MVTGTIILEVMSFEVPELTELGQFDVLNFSCITADGFVEVNDFE